MKQAVDYLDLIDITLKRLIGWFYLSSISIIIAHALANPSLANYFIDGLLIIVLFVSGLLILDRVRYPSKA